MNSKLYFTRQGLTKLRKEIKDLENRLRHLQSQTASAAEIGGNQYHDNASYEMLVIDIRGINWQIAEAYRTLNNAVIVEPPININSVAIGTRVKIIRDGREITWWEIVGFGESDPNRKMLAYNTLLASLIMGKQRGEVATGTIAGHETEIEILEIAKGGAE